LEGEKHAYHRAFLEWVECQGQTETARRCGMPLGTVRWLRKRWQWDTRAEVWFNAQAEEAAKQQTQMMQLTKEGESLLVEARERAHRLNRLSSSSMALCEQLIDKANKGENVSTAGIAQLMAVSLRCVDTCRSEVGYSEAMQSMLESLEQQIDDDDKGNRWSGHRS